MECKKIKLGEEHLMRDREKTTNFNDDLPWNLHIAYDLINSRHELKFIQIKKHLTPSILVKPAKYLLVGCADMLDLRVPFSNKRPCKP